MILDGIIILIILLACIIGHKCGLAAGLSRLGSWLVAVALAFTFSRPLKTYLCDNTMFDEGFYAKFVAKLSGDSKADSMDALPGLFQDQITDAKLRFVNATATQLTDIVMAIFAFLIILIGVKLLALAFAFIFSKKHNKGVIGFADGVLGTFMGFLIGVIIVITLMAFAVPFALTSSDQFATLFETASQGSYIAKYFYDYNLILIFIKSFII